LPPRGPMPERWLDYHGHYLHGDRVIMSYAVDRREILELAEAEIESSDPDGPITLVQTLKIGAGERLVLAVAQRDGLPRHWNATDGSAHALMTHHSDGLKSSEAASPDAASFAVGLRGDREG